jgi:hypothetical protein
MFDSCETLDEILVAASIDLPPDQLDLLLAATEPTRRMLREAQGRLTMTGMTELAALCAKHAKTAKRGPPTFAERRRQQLRRMHRMTKPVQRRS